MVCPSMCISVTEKTEACCALCPPCWVPGPPVTLCCPSLSHLCVMLPVPLVVCKLRLLKGTVPLQLTSLGGPAVASRQLLCHPLGSRTRSSPFMLHLLLTVCPPCDKGAEARSSLMNFINMQDANEAAPEVACEFA